MGVLNRILITGGAGFIGSALVRRLTDEDYHVVDVDKLTYSGNVDSLRSVRGAPNHRFYQCDISDQLLIASILTEQRVEAAIHLAAETHVDRSIDSPAAFVETNVVGTFQLLNVTLDYWRHLDEEARARFRFHHVSTNEVFGHDSRMAVVVSGGLAARTVSIRSKLEKLTARKACD